MKLKRLLDSAYSLLVMFGFDPGKTISSFRGLPFYYLDLRILIRQKKSSKTQFKFGKPYPCLADRFTESGTFNWHYFHQDLLVARRINLNSPVIHIDVGSRVDGFVAHVASFRAIHVIDIRPQPHEIPNIDFIQADLMGKLNESLIDCSDSVSCLHALEHFGLGRYGDRVNYDGYLLGLDNLSRMLRQYGKLYLSVPIGPQRLEFNGQRVFSLDYLLQLFKNRYRIDCFSFVDDDGKLHENAVLRDEHVNGNFGCYYGCGIFEMTKL